jgi:hypothetical protein
VVHGLAIQMLSSLEFMGQQRQVIQQIHDENNAIRQQLEHLQGKIESIRNFNTSSSCTCPLESLQPTEPAQIDLNAPATEEEYVSPDLGDQVPSLACFSAF